MYMLKFSAFLKHFSVLHQNLWFLTLLANFFIKSFVSQYPGKFSPQKIQCIAFVVSVRALTLYFKLLLKFESGFFKRVLNAHWSSVLIKLTIRIWF